MSDRPTPETDAYCLRAIGFPTGYEWREFARNLERRRDAAIERFQSSQEARASLKRELDEAREQIAKANSERENDTQAELAAWELLRDTRELARELRDVLEELLDPEYLYAFGKDDDSERCIVFHAQERASKAITKAKEVLP